ncbi:MAG: efflux RND transporter periplasmic adaptor subunit [Pseudomonadota bacterium]
MAEQQAKAIRPKFRPDIKVHEYEEKAGGQSLVLEDPVGNKFFRISQYEYDLLKIFDGNLTVSDALQRLRLHGRHFTEQYASKLVEQFARSGLLLGTGYGTARAQVALKNHIEGEMRKRAGAKLFFLFIPLINPDRFLEKTYPIVRFFMNRFTGALLLLMIPGAVFLLLNGLSRIDSHYFYFFNFQNLLVLWVALTISKLVHELAHAYTAKAFGLRVPEMGVYLLVFFPRPYCNTTAAWQLADRSRRMAIAGAGVLAEAALAVLACYVWYFSKPGIINSTAFYLIVVSLLSSLLFNGNPLLKFDGYFVLTDWLRMPNLQAKALAYLRYLFLNGVCGIESITVPRAGVKERFIQVTYGVLAFLYRVMIVFAITASVYYTYDKSIGLLMGSFALAMFILKPTVTTMLNMAKRRTEMHVRPVGLAAFALIAGVAIFLLTRPWSDRSVYPCYLDSATVRQISAASDAPVLDVPVRPGDRVKAGDILIRLDPIPLGFVLKDKEILKDVVEKDISIIESTQENLEKLQLLVIDRSQAEDAVRQVKEELNAVEWRAPFDGAITKLVPHLQPGSKPGKGTVVGEIADVKDCEVLGLIPEADVAAIRVGSPVDVWFPHGSGRSYALTVKEISPFKTEDLEGSPFSSRFGGEIATEAAEGAGKDNPLEPVYLCKMGFVNTDGIPLGITGRLVVRHAPRSLLTRIIDAAYHTFHREIIF